MNNFHQVSQLAEKQGGLITRPQLTALGYLDGSISYAIDEGLLIRQLKGIYRLKSTIVTRETHLWAALLWAGDGAVLSHHTAGWLWKLEGLGRKPPDVIELSVPIDRQLVSHKTIRAWRTRTLVHAKDWAKLGGLPVTSVARTLIDLAKTLSPKNLEHAYDSAVRRNRETAAAVFDAIKRLGTRGRRGVEELIEIASRNELGCTQSWLEDEVRIALRNANVRLPLPQFQINDDDGRQICISDFAWPEVCVVVAADSYEHHGLDRRGFEKDRLQLSKLSAIGWRVVPITYRRLVSDEAGFIRELKQALRFA
jgi:hypothetical protein